MGQAADGLRDADEIREDIERTRDDMAQTLDAIGDKVSPRLQAERQAERLRQAGIAPQRIAVAAAGLILALLLMKWRRSHRQDA